jgi:hypothetical protein
MADCICFVCCLAAELPADLLHTLLLCTHSISTALPLVMSGPRRAIIAPALPVLYGILQDVLRLSSRALSSRPGADVVAGSSSSSSRTGAVPGDTEPCSGNTGSSSNASMEAPQSMHSKGSNQKQSSRKAKRQSSGKGLPAGSPAKARGHPASSTEDRADGTAATPEMQPAAPATDPARACDWRGLLAGALTAHHRVYFFHTAFDPTYCPGRLAKHHAHCPILHATQGASLHSSPCAYQGSSGPFALLSAPGASSG